MQKDFKIGMAVGTLLAVVAMLWLSTRPSLSTRARMLRSENTESRQQDSGSPSSSSSHGLAAETQVPMRDNGQLSIADSRSGVPDYTVYEKPEKIKTQRFHIVCDRETLSGISYKYYGSASKWQKIFEANRSRIRDPHKIAPGTKLIIPD
jgi:nucleoid-associated protein YgaU